MIAVSFGLNHHVGIFLFFFAASGADKTVFVFCRHTTDFQPVAPLG